MGLSNEALRQLLELSRRCEPPPWTARVEGRDHESGDSFIQVGESGQASRRDRDEG